MMMALNLRKWDKSLRSRRWTICARARIHILVKRMPVWSLAFRFGFSIISFFFCFCSATCTHRNGWKLKGMGTARAARWWPGERGRNLFDFDNLNREISLRSASVFRLVSGSLCCCSFCFFVGPFSIPSSPSQLWDGSSFAAVRILQFEMSLGAHHRKEQKGMKHLSEGASKNVKSQSRWPWHNPFECLKPEQSVRGMWWKIHFISHAIMGFCYFCPFAPLKDISSCECAELHTQRRGFSLLTGCRFLGTGPPLPDRRGRLFLQNNVSICVSWTVKESRFSPVAKYDAIIHRSGADVQTGHGGEGVRAK